MCRKLFYLVVLALVAIQICLGQNNNTATGGQTDPNSKTTDGTEEPAALEKGMKGVFGLMHNFLDTVMPENFYDAESAKFSK